MQNAQNTEIQQRVINLVELYRTKVGKESQIAKEAKSSYDYEQQYLIDSYIRTGMSIGLVGEVQETSIKHLMVNEQLLGHFYAEVAGEAAEEYVLEQMQQDSYDNTVFSEEEENFLKAHFKEMVNYIVQTPSDDSLKWVQRGDEKDVFTIPQEVLELISSRVEIAAGSRIFYPEAVFAQITNLYSDCKFYFDSGYHIWLMVYSKLGDKDKGQDYGLYAWERIVLYANKIDATFLDGRDMPSAYDAVVSYLPSRSLSSAVVEHLCKAYKGLPTGGKLLLLCPPELLAGKGQSSAKAKFEDVLAYGEDVSVKKELSEAEANEVAYASFRKMLVEDKSIKEIIQLPQVMSSQAWSDTYCLLVVEKGRMSNDTVMIDARNAYSDMDSDHFSHVFDIEKFNAILLSEGKEPCTGLRKVVKIASDNLSVDLLIPQVYVVEKPTEAESPVPLSKLCELESTLIRDVQFDLPEDTPWISMSDLTPLFTGDLDMSAIRRADCPNNPHYSKGSKDYAFNSKGKFIDSVFAQMDSAKGIQVHEYRNSFFVDGESDNVLYEYSDEQGVRVAVARPTSKPYAVSKGVLVFRPKDGFDAQTLAAMLRLPIVSRQLLVYEQFGIGIHLDDILVPTDKCIIGDELYRMEREKYVTDELGEKVQAMKTDFINEVRMRKHDMGQIVFDLINTEDLMRYYVENRETENDLWPQLEEQLDHLHHTIHELSEMLDHLSQEEHFGSPELINLDEYLRSIQHSKSVSGFALSYQLDKDGVANALIIHKNDKRIADEQNIRIHPTVWIAKNDIQRIVGNIISNAQKHGFIDSSRQDYEVKIVLSFNSEKGMYQIDFRNNGQPLPEGLNKMRYGIKGEKAGQTAGTGLGGSVVKSIVEHYKGDYDVFMDGEWTVIRVYLPIAI